MFQFPRIACRSNAIRRLEPEPLDQAALATAAFNEMQLTKSGGRLVGAHGGHVRCRRTIVRSSSL
jgi:hypothetical protein